MTSQWLTRFLVAASVVLGAAGPVQAADEMVVIVNAANPATSLDKAAIKAYYLNIKGTWPDGAKVRAVDNPSDAGARSQFVTKVLGMSVAEFERHWIERQYASGDGPPAKAN